MNIHFQNGRGAQSNLTNRYSSLNYDEMEYVEEEGATNGLTKYLEVFAKAGIPVMVNIAPVVPGLTDIEIMKIAKAAAAAGALGIGYNVLRLPGEVEQVFTDWLEKAFPLRKEKVLNQTKAVHGGQIQDAQSGRRMRGEGVIAHSIKQQVEMARNKFFKGRTIPELRCDLFDPKVNGQISLF